MFITFKLEKDGKKWHAFCPELTGCHTFGATKQEALKYLKDAVLLYMEDEIENQSMKAVITVTELNKKTSHV
jgi:predicted RNase H-like HicB family nuclease